MNTGVTLLVCFHWLLSKTDALYGYISVNCVFASEDGHDALYDFQFYFNKQLFASYKSTEEKYRGYNEKIKHIIDGFNKNLGLLEDRKKNTEECKKTVPQLATVAKTAVQKPQVKVFSSKAANGHHPGIITCSAYNFYPKPITLTWLRNGEEVKSDVIFTDEMSNGNWLYQIHSHLEYTPTPSDTIHCLVEHASLPEPQVYKWEYFSDSQRNKISVGTAGLLLGLVFAIVGAIYYKKNTRGRLLVLRYEECSEQR